MTDELEKLRAENADLWARIDKEVQAEQRVATLEAALVESDKRLTLGKASVALEEENRKLREAAKEMLAELGRLQPAKDLFRLCTECGTSEGVCALFRTKRQQKCCLECKHPPEFPALQPAPEGAKLTDADWTGIRIPVAVAGGPEDSKPAEPGKCVCPSRLFPGKDLVHRDYCPAKPPPPEAAPDRCEHGHETPHVEAGTDGKRVCLGPRCRHGFLRGTQHAQECRLQDQLATAQAREKEAETYEESKRTFEHALAAATERAEKAERETDQLRKNVAYERELSKNCIAERDAALVKVTELEGGG